MSEATEVKVQENQSKPNNEIRVGNRSKPKELIAQCEKLLKEDKLKEIHLTAVGNSIGDLIIAVEILKSSNPGLFQQSIFSTIGPRSPKNPPKDKEKEKENEKPQKLYPHKSFILIQKLCFPVRKSNQKKLQRFLRKIEKFFWIRQTSKRRTITSRKNSILSEGEEEMRDLDTEDKDSPYLPEEM